MAEIKKIIAREILDSRGRPTVEADVILSDESVGRASVPSGASTGSMEALELRDKDPLRFNGFGVLKAVTNIEKIIQPSLIGLSPFNQLAIDESLITLDNSKNKEILGANAMLAVSLAVAKAAANSRKLPFFRYLAPNNQNYLMPKPLMNIINGGAHADNEMEIQECMIIPMSGSSIKESIRIGAEIFYKLKEILKAKGHSTSVGDEGGFAPKISSVEQALDFILDAVKQAGYIIEKDIVLALDCAASEFYQAGKYHIAGKKYDSQELITYYEQLIKNYPIYSIEDPMAEDDQMGWKLISEKLKEKVMLVGDDLFVTNPQILQKSISENIANSVLIKPNQIGTLSETLDAIKIAQISNYRAIISHRSGETEDTSIAHIAVATNAGYIKCGSLSRTDRTAKYNELIRIEEILARADF